MKEFIEKLIGRLEEAKFPITDLKQGVVVNGIQQTDDAVLYSRAIEIVNQLAEEYNDGWIPCSEKMPADCGEDWVQVQVQEVDTEFLWIPRTAEFRKDGKWWLIDDTEKPLEYPFEVVAWRKLPPQYQPKGE